MARFQGRALTSLVVTIIFLVASTVFVTLRMISRIVIARRAQLDDYFILAAWIVGFGLSFSICFGTSVGLGRHQNDVLPEWQSPLKKSEYAFSVLYNPALMLTKTSILIFYLRLSATERVFKWACYATLVTVNVGGLALSVLNIAQCRPLSSGFMTPIPADAKCTDIVTLYLSSAPLNIITDLAILFLPFPILTSIRLPRKQKIILLVTFGFGVFVAVVDVIRIGYLQQAFQSRLASVSTGSQVTVDPRTNSDFSWYGSLSYMWSAIEVHVGIIVACVPALKPLVSRFLPRMLRDVDEEDFTRRESDIEPKDLARLRASQRKNSAVDPNGLDQIEKVEEQSSGERQMGLAEFLASPAVAHTHQGDQIGMMDFLTTPDMTELPNAERTQTVASRYTRSGSPTFFDFVNMQRKKSIVYMTTQESLWSVAMVTVLFFIWGFAYGLLDTLNEKFQQVAGMSTGQTMGIHSAYFSGYFVAPVTFGRLVLKIWGFKACYIVGLAIYGCGTLIFWPAAVLTSFPAFLVSNFIVGMGLSTLEISANPFIALCGPAQYMEARLNFSQGVQAIGSVVAPLLAMKVLFKSANDGSSLTDTQWTYLAIALFSILLAVAYYYVPLPEVTDAELEDVAERPDNANNAELRLPFLPASHAYVKVTMVTLAIGVFSQFCYVGGQEAISTAFAGYLAENNPAWNPGDYQVLGHSVFAIARFITAALNVWGVKPRHLLLFFYVGLIVFSALCTASLGPAANSTVVMLVYFFEGPLFSLIYAMALRGLGRHTKDATAAMTASIVGGAIIPPIMQAVVEHSSTQRRAWGVVVAVFIAGTSFGVWANGLRSVKTTLDPLRGVSDDNASSRSFSDAASADNDEDSVRRNAGGRIKGHLKKTRWKGGGGEKVSRRSREDSMSAEHQEKS